MKTSILNILAVLTAFLTAFLTGSCSFFQVDDPAPPVNYIPPGSGILNIAVPTVPSYLSNALSAISEETGIYQPLSRSTTSGSKAIGFATSVEVTIMDSGNNQIYFGGFSPETMTPGGNVSVSLVLPAGENYQAQVQVYNQAISTIDPTVSGASGDFTITAGETMPVLIKAVPADPTTLNPGQIQPLNTAVPSKVDPGDFQITAVGGEYWYHIAPVTVDGLITLSITHSNSDDHSGFCDMVIYADDEFGAMIKNIMSPGVRTFEGDRTLSYTFQATIGTGYFVGIMPLSLNTDTEAEFSIMYTQGFTDNLYEPNDSQGEATPLTGGIPLYAVADISSHDWFSFTIENYISKIRIETFFEEDGSQLHYYLIRTGGMVVDQGDITAFGFSRTFVLDPDTYYIELYPKNNTGAYAVSYRLSWETLATYQDDGFEQNDFANQIDATLLAEGPPGINGISLDNDYYQFTLAAPQTVTVTCQFSHADGNIDLRLIDSNYTTYYANSVSDDEIIENTVMPAGICYIGVMKSDKPGTSYNLFWETVP